METGDLYPLKKKFERFVPPSQNVNFGGKIKKFLRRFAPISIPLPKCITSLRPWLVMP